MPNVVDERMHLRHSSVGAKKVNERFMASDQCEITTVKLAPFLATDRAFKVIKGSSTIGMYCHLGKNCSNLFFNLFFNNISVKLFSKLYLIKF